MKGLIQKDILLMGNQKKSLGIILLCGLSMFFSMDGSGVVTYLAMVGSIAVLSTISYDELENGYSYLLTCPVSRITYVREKYAFSILWAAVCCVIGTAADICVSLIRNQLVLEEAGMSLMVSMMLALFMFALMIPLQLKYGREKSKYVLYGIFAVILFAGFWIQEMQLAAFEQLMNGLGDMHEGVNQQLMIYWNYLVITSK